MDPSRSEATFIVRDYDLSATLNSGQAFRWIERSGAWEGVIGVRWVRLTPGSGMIRAEAATPVTDWSWLQAYLQLDVDLEEILRCFPDDPALQTAVEACRGLRLLRQDPWECLASFILSSTKQIVQIRQIVEELCRRFGERIPGGTGAGAVTFPDAIRLAGCMEMELRECKMGFRAPNLLEAARRVASGELDLEAVGREDLAGARAMLESLPGVGRKIADCVLLFAYGFPTAFPVDVWVQRALRELYFRNRRLPAKRLERFCSVHFGPQAGYAQQYLFHYMRGRRRE